MFCIHSWPKLISEEGSVAFINLLSGSVTQEMLTSADIDIRMVVFVNDH